MNSRAKIIKIIVSGLSFFARAFNKLGLLMVSRVLFYVKDKIVLNYIDKYYHSFIDSYFSNYNNVSISKCNRIVWICWLQGIENANCLTKKCVDTIVKNNPDIEVRVVSLSNINNYLNIPNYLTDNLRKGIISYTNYSDIIRFMLLEKYGGMWIDATYYSIDKIPYSYFTHSFFSGAKHIESKKREMVCISHARWVTSFLGSNHSHYKLFSFLASFLLEYEKTTGYFVDYLLIDYLIFIAYTYDSKIRSDIDNVPLNNEDSSWLIYHLNKPFNIDEWQKCCKKGTIFFKLSNKKKWKCFKGKETTYYNELIVNG